MTQIKQHSKMWYLIKQYNLGANDIACLLGVGFTDRQSVINQKISGEQQEFSAFTQKLMDKGTKYEPIVRSLFETRHKVSIKETGLMRHKDYSFITASPDGYCKNSEGKFSIGPFLTEFKVKSELSDKIPIKYWVQMQVQMEIWNISHCIYCENVINESADGWQLVEYNEHIVGRNKEWWNSIISQIVNYWNIIKKGRSNISTRSIKRKLEDEDNQPLPLAKIAHYREIIQPYMLGNYFRKDPLLDWLNLYGPVEERDTEANAFMTMINNQNKKFSRLVSEFIKSKYTDDVYDCCPNPFARYSEELEPYKPEVDDKSIKLTQKAIDNKYPIVLNPCFSVPYHDTLIGGRADMMILNEYLHLLGIRTDDKSDRYSLVNFKYSTINLKADGRYLLKNPKQSVYKAQACLLNKALTITQGYRSSHTYIIGRKYDYTKSRIKYKINNAFECIGQIHSSECEDELEGALDWLQSIKTPEAKLWDPFKPENLNMYPNMKNSSDHPWHNFKRKIAHHINDITLMYYCGPEVRKYAMEHGITELSSLTEDSIKFGSGKILDRINLFLNAKDTQGLDNLSNKFYVKNTPCVEFFLDFEAIGNIYDDFSTFPIANDNAMIFLIGIICADNVNSTKQYYSYLVDSLHPESEKIMLNSMLSDIKGLANSHDQDYLPIYYWSNAENYMLKRALGDNMARDHNLIMIDLCKAFKDCGFCIAGQTGYGLKEVAKLMHESGMIQTTWINDINGLNASIKAIKYYNKGGKDCSLDDIIDYNYIDCKVIEEILEYLRTSV